MSAGALFKSFLLGVGRQALRAGRRVAPKLARKAVTSAITSGADYAGKKASKAIYNRFRGKKRAEIRGGRRLYPGITVYKGKRSQRGRARGLRYSGRRSQRGRGRKKSNRVTSVRVLNRCPFAPY